MIFSTDRNRSERHCCLRPPGLGKNHPGFSKKILPFPLIGAATHKYRQSKRTVFRSPVHLDAEHFGPARRAKTFHTRKTPIYQKMKKMLTVFSLLLIGVSAGAQLGTVKTEVTQGPEFNEGMLTTMTEIIGTDDEGIYGLFEMSGMGGVKGHKIAAFGHDLALKAIEETDAYAGGEDRHFKRAVLTDNKLLLLTTLNNQSEGRRVLYVQQLDKNSLKPIGNEAELVVNTTDHRRGTYNTHFLVSLSPDRSKIAVFFKGLSSEGDFPTFCVHVFDEKLNELWAQNTNYPFDDYMLTTSTVAVANNGDLYVPGMEVEDVHNRREPMGYYTIQEISNNGKTLRTHRVNEDYTYIDRMQVQINDRGEVLCGGFIYDSKSTGAAGSFFAKLDREKGEITHRSSDRFTLEFIAQDLSSSDARKVMNKAEKDKDVGIEKFFLDRMLLTDNGGAILIGEQYYPLKTSSTRTEYLLDDIVVVFISPEGDITATQKIPKRQGTTNDGGQFSSYVALVKGDKIHFLYNDDPKNLEYAGDGKFKTLKNPNKADVILATARGGDNIAKRALTDEDLGSHKTKPTVSLQSSPDEIVLYAEKSTSKKLIRVKFTD